MTHNTRAFFLFTSLSCLALAIGSCEGNRQIKNTEEEIIGTSSEKDTAIVVETGKTADEQLEEFRGWLNRQARKGDTAIREEWPEMKEKLRERNARLEQNFDSLSSKSKAEFRELQARYKRFEEEEEKRRQQPLNTNELKKWQEQLLREFSTPEAITAANAREAYLTFMGVVRAKRRNWTQNDWDYVDYVYGQLNDRYSQIRGQVSAADNIKIRSLQTEYLALESAADTKSILRD